MSTLYNGPLGNLSGKVGGVVFRRRRGRVFIYTSPMPYEPPNSEAAVAQRTKFAFLRRMSACTAKDHLLKGLWNGCTLPGGIGYERQMKVNTPLYNNLDISGLKLVPADDLFPAAVSESLLEDMVLKITTAPISISIGYRSDLKISAHGIMLLSGAAQNKPSYQFVPLTSEEHTFVNGSVYNFHSAVKCDNIDDYPDRSFALCLIIKDVNGVPEKFSVNV